MSENSTSLKDQGNEEFKRGNYPMAIQFYSQYVQTDNPDNEKAYTNLAMSHFKLGNYYPCIEACQKALLKDRTFAKAYYRLYLSYKELPSEEYNTFVNAHLFLKNFKEANPASRLEALKVYNEFKDKFKSKKRELAIHNSSVLQDLLRSDSQVMPIEGEVGSVLEWEEFFTNKGKRREDKLARIQQEMEVNPEGGINLGYMYLNTIDKKEEKKLVAERIHQIRDQLAERRKRQSTKDIKFEQMAEESSENLFQSQKEEEVQQQPISNSSKIQSSSSKQPQIGQNLSEPNSNAKLPKEDIINTLSITQQKSKPFLGASQAEQLAEKIEQKAQTKQILLDSGFLSRIPGRLSSSRDIFSTLQEIIMQILQSTSPLEEKRSFLQHLPKQIREICMIRSSFSTATQNKIHLKLKQIGLQSLSQIYSPKVK